MMNEEIISVLADRLGKLTVVGLQGNEAGPLERYVRRVTLLDLAEDVLAVLGRPRWPSDREALIAVVGELRRARRLHAKFPTFRHALGVIREECREFEDAVMKADASSRARAAAAVELVQLAATAVRTLTDLTLPIEGVIP